jgi:hypothetical protein
VNGLAEKKHTYVATMPDGEVIDRTTARTYTHVIIAKHSDWYWESHRKKSDAKWGGTENYFFPITWAGTPELAAKAFRAAQTSHMHSRDADNGKLMHKDVRMLPVKLKR